MMRATSSKYASHLLVLHNGERYTYGMDVCCGRITCERQHSILPLWYTRERISRDSKRRMSFTFRIEVYCVQPRCSKHAAAPFRLAEPQMPCISKARLATLTTVRGNSSLILVCPNQEVVYFGDSSGPCLSIAGSHCFPGTFH